MWVVIVALALLAGGVLLVKPRKEGAGPPAGFQVGPDSPDYIMMRWSAKKARDNIYAQFKWYFEMPESPYNWSWTIHDGLKAARTGNPFSSGP